MSQHTWGENFKENGEDNRVIIFHLSQEPCLKILSWIGTQDHDDMSDSRLWENYEKILLCAIRKCEVEKNDDITENLALKNELGQTQGKPLGSLRKKMK